jgi:UDP-N-acetylmuramoyl-tripeptide--D-alanyl-D-alanine ligase
MSVPSNALVRATGGTIVNGPLPERLRIATDSRAMEPGDTFLALRGPAHNGNDYVTAAHARGAIAAVVDDANALPPGLPALVVSDTLAAYGAAGRIARDQSGATVIGITGSAGKTTTKALLAQLISRTPGGPVVASDANENNEVGVPKTLLRVEPGTRYAVIEMGCRRFGDIDPLVAAARPDVAVITNVGDAHLEIMGSRERLIETKFGILSGGARPVLNALDADSRARAASAGLRDVLWFAAVDGAAAEPAVEGPLLLLRGRESIEWRCGDGTVRSAAVELRLPGAHNLANLAAALAAALAIGAGLDALAGAAGSLRLPPGRYERDRVGAFDVIYDAYNASMSGTLATLQAFAAEQAERRIVVLGSMAELGEDAPAMHRRVGGAAVAVADAVLVGGDFADELASGAREAGIDPERLVRFGGNREAADWLREHARAGDLVLLKASRKYRLEEILDRLRAR